MPTCLHCDARVSDEGVSCGNCGAAINPPATPVDASQPQAPSPRSNPSPTAPSTEDLHVRLEKAMRRAELLSYAAAGLGVATLFAIIGIAFV
jgi:hypothetical protein